MGTDLRHRRQADRRHDLGPVLLSAEQLRVRVGELGQEIGRDYEGRAPLLVAVLKGAFIFLADLVRAIPVPQRWTSWPCPRTAPPPGRPGIVRIVKDLDIDLVDRHVLIVEDIVDSGLTLAYLRRMLAARNPASLEVCALLARSSIPPVDRASLRYIGFSIPEDWVVGYGLDVGERWRNLGDVRLWDGPI